MNPVTQTIFTLAGLLIAGTVGYAVWWFVDMAHRMKHKRRLIPIRNTRNDYPTAFDSSRINPRIRAVRRDYLHAAHPRIHHPPHHSHLLEQARTRIHRLGYIQHHLTEEDPDGNPS